MSLKRTKVVDISQAKASHKPIKASSIDVNASSGPAIPALELDELQAKVQRVVMYGSVGEARHSVNDRAYRNVSMDDILFMLDRPWVLSAKPDWDEKHRNWEYLLAGTDIEGDPLCLKITVNDELLRILVITKF